MALLLSERYTGLSRINLQFGDIPLKGPGVMSDPYRVALLQTLGEISISFIVSVCPTAF